MKKTIALKLALCFAVLNSMAQDIPTQKLLYTDFDLKKDISQVGTGYYTADSMGYDPAQLHILQFDSTGKLTLEYSRIYGKFASQTAHHYIYKNGKLDSLNTRASAENFNADSKYHYNKKGRLDSITCTGKYTNYVETFFYDKKGSMTRKLYKHANGSGWTENYHYDQDGSLEYVVKKEGNQPASFTYYIGKDKFASYEEGGNWVTFYYTRNGDVKLQPNDEPEEMVPEMRAAKIRFPDKYKGEEDDLFRKCEYLYVIPGNVRASSGEWTKRYIIDMNYGQNKRYYVFRKYIYSDNTEVGETSFDTLFQMNIEKRNLHKLQWN